ncbi:MAG: sn-glycerol-3-phosphate import ATP-binding protein UgpC [Alphaproteobacteria bacterium]|nr:sn-glycerol-3-phosphate import ATP-binding protein UgpC [Alphaproteobacteria bacterium]
MAEVGLKNVKKSYGGMQVIHGIDCAIKDGEFMVLVGPSGCGKSTLLRMIAGLEEISAGEISIDGRVVNDVEPKDRDIAMVFQNYALYPHMSVYDNMAYGLRIRGLSKAEIDERVNKAAGILQLQELLQRKPRQLSGGQRQRVAMGRAIVRDPKVFLFDEPLSNLDAKLRVQMRVEIKQLQNRLGTTAVYVTHDQVEAMTLADRLVVMNAGVAEQIGAPLEVYAKPASLFVAGFIGSPAMNFLAGKISGDGRAVELAGGARVALADGRFASSAGRKVTLGVRPEHLVQDGAGTAAHFQLAIELVETLGADTLLHGRIDGKGDGLIVRVDGATMVKSGQTLALHAPPGALHLFDGETGKRLSD